MSAEEADNRPAPSQRKVAPTPLPSAMSPNPLPAVIMGVIVLNGSASPDCTAPVEPHSTPSPSSMRNSCGPSLSSWYWNVVPKFWKPATVPPFSGRIWVQPPDSVTPKSWVIRLERSTLISTWFAVGTSAVLNQSRVGSDISSATQGSSVTSVAGRKRLPTKQCAWAGDSGKATKIAEAVAATAPARRRNFVLIVVAPRPTAIGASINKVDVLRKAQIRRQAAGGARGLCGVEAASPERWSGARCRGYPYVVAAATHAIGRLAGMGPVDEPNWCTGQSGPHGQTW